MDRHSEKDNNLAVYWHRPLGALDVVRRLTIRKPRQQRQPGGQYGSGACWSCPIGSSEVVSSASSPPWRRSSSSPSSRGVAPTRLQILELDCPDHVDESFLVSILDSVLVVADGTLLNDELRQLRSLRGCHDAVVRWFLQRFDWRIVELADHHPTVLACLPHSIIELRLSDDLSIQDWQTMVRRGQQLCQRDGGHPFLLRSLWLERAPRDPNVSTVLLRHVIRDTSFVVSGPPDVMKMMEDLQWYSALNVWSSLPQQGKARNGSSPPLPLSGADTRRKAVRIIKEWKQRLEQQPDDGPLVLTVQRPGQAAVVVDDSSPREQRGEVVVVAAVGPSPPRPPVAAVSKHNTRRTSGGGGGGVYVCPHRRKVKTTPFFQAPLVPSEARN
jgi:hypothetical protein